MAAKTQFFLIFLIIFLHMIQTCYTESEDEKNWVDLQKDIKNSENSLTFIMIQDIVKKIIILRRIL